MSFYLNNKRVVITGGTGSFGAALAQKIAESAMCEVVIFSRNRERQQKMRERFPTFKYIIGDILNRADLENAIDGADYLIHAAALKEVPYCEENPMEATLINITGTNIVIDSAIAKGVKKVLIVSTDKAVLPSSAMGISKAMMEKVVWAKANQINKSSPVKESITSLIVIRFGNLLGSTGTVIPLFIKQIRDGKPLTVTNPDMTRFMMTLEQSVNYALFALENGVNGDLIIERASSVSIGDIASAVIEQIPGSTSDNYTITGARPGEKLYEVMATEQEMLRCEVLNNNYLRVSMTHSAKPQQLNPLKELNSHTAPRLDRCSLKEIIDEISLQID
ncbi:MAG: UDP-glucose 4-epimerase [Bacteroidetes bacterium HGW-Bacteroidetes-8]|jgi:UDP-glucose 4-epimerase|nr:MAG: UDP-glucose 4-epimerase [Bacteroidetes bacterium HGW-Bacteroidetes-8]